MKWKLGMLIVLLLCAVMATAAANAEIIGNGMCGENISWELDDAGTLTIIGSGEMINTNSYLKH